jgi:hypothetical protein
MTDAGDGHEFPLLISDHLHDRIALFRDGRLVWEQRGDHPQDVWQLADGRVLVAWRDAVQEIIPDLPAGRGGAVAWEYRLPEPGEIPTCQPLPDGNVLVGIGGPCRLVEVDRQGAVRRQVPLASGSGAHTQFRFCRRTSAGTYLVPHLGDNRVREYDADGRILWEEAFPAPVSVVHLPDGRTLVGGGQEIREYDDAHRLIWRVTGTELGLRFRVVAGIQILADGSLLAALWGASGGTPDDAQIVVITRGKRVAWRVFANAQIGNVAVALRLDRA